MRTTAAISVSSERAFELGEWEVARVAPDSVLSLEQLDELEFRPVSVPGTVAMVGWRDDADSSDYWYRCSLEIPAQPGTRTVLSFEGLATLAEVWLDGEKRLTSDNMFRTHSLEIDAGPHRLTLRFASLNARLRKRGRGRGRWTVRLVSEKNLRHVRTTCLGYMPGCCPPTRPVGPWRPIRLVRQYQLAVERFSVRTDWSDGVGSATLQLEVGSLGARIESAVAALSEFEEPLAVRTEGDRFYVEGRVSGMLAAWFPHTHGAPIRHPLRISLLTDQGVIEVDCGLVGLRRVELNRTEGAFEFRINEVPIFARGASWMPLDLESLDASPAALRSALAQARDAGLNMLRLPGITVYETDAFYRLCDELGILVWQDFMFANFDYPTDADFVDNCRVEVEQFLERTSTCASLALLCGGSETTQQAAMNGLPRESWTQSLFDSVIPELTARSRPDLPYIASTPTGGVMPFHSKVGPSHYYGVGAYLRPLDDARSTSIRFASECLAFSIPPTEASWRARADRRAESVPAPHEPRYKAGVPRDMGAGWDFADVTDHYIETMLDTPVRELRYTDPQRYRALSQLVVSELMAQTLGIWRRAESSCAGALVWTLRDLEFGAGWGLIDSEGVPKAPYYALRRTLAPRALWFIDDGLEGLSLHLASERESAAGRLSVSLMRCNGETIASGERDVRVARGDTAMFNVDELVGHFVDSSYAYRFGPPAHDLVFARFDCGDGQHVVAHYFRGGLGVRGGSGAHLGPRSVVIRGQLEPSEGGFHITVESESLALFVAVECDGHEASDSFFHLFPGKPRSFQLTPRAGGKPFESLRLRPLNGLGCSVVTYASPDRST